MKIKYKNDANSDSLSVYAIYWINNDNYFLISPKLHKGVIAVAEKEVDIIDATLDANMAFTKSLGGTSMITYESLAKDNFLDALLDDGQNNYDEFLARIKS